MRPSAVRQPIIRRCRDGLGLPLLSIVLLGCCAMIRSVLSFGASSISKRGLSCTSVAVVTSRRSTCGWATSVMPSRIQTQPIISASGGHLATRLHSSTSPDDMSATARSRAPFSGPRGSHDDAIPEGPDASAAAGDGEDAAAPLWSSLGLITELVDTLSKPTSQRGMGFSAGPTPVQKMAIPAILQGYAPYDADVEARRRSKDATSSFGADAANTGEGNVAFAAATGSGKTLAYLLPVVQMLKSDELLSLSLSPEQAARLRKPKRPRAIVLAPTRELSTQILTVLKEISHSAKVSSESLVGGEDYGRQRKRLESRPVDIVVATPGRLVKHLQAGNMFLGSVRHVVVDEFDTMLEQGFQSDLGTILHPLLYQKKVVYPSEVDRLRLVEGAPQIVLTTATMTNAVRRLLADPTVEPKKQYRADPDPNKEVNIVLPKDVRVLTAPGLHKAVPRLRQTFVDVGNADKLSLLNDIVSGSGGQGSVVTRSDGSLPDGSGHALTLVFCNTVPSARAAQHSLAESGVPSLCYHGDLSSADRADNLQTFRNAASSSDPDAPRVLVCTDIAARGLDVPEVDHVCMFDFPLNPIDYLHRAGRTARATAVKSMRAGSGRVTALISKRDRVLAGAIERAVREGEPLDQLSSRKSDYQQGGRLDPSMKRAANRPRGRDSDRSSGRGGGGRGGGRGGRGGRGRGGGRRGRRS